jgi:hypothetical protein
LDALIRLFRKASVETLTRVRLGSEEERPDAECGEAAD